MQPQRAAAEVIINVQQLEKRYTLGRQRVYALRGTTLSVQKGEFVAIVGASGSGKSTLLHLMGGLDKPTSGTVTVQGKVISKLRDRALSKFRNQTIGFIFQSFYLQPFLTVRKNIEVAAMPHRMKRSERTARIQQIAEKVGLSDRLQHKPKELSGGQIQRVAIARALLNQPAIILADEPTGNLDSGNSHDIIQLLLELRRDYGTTIVIATHDHEIAAQADRIITVKDGEIV